MINWGEALGVLIGVIVGGILTGGVSFVLDRQRRVHDDQVRRERWQREDARRDDERRRDDALDNRRHLRDLFGRTFTLVNSCETAVAAFALTPSDVTAYKHVSSRTDGRQRSSGSSSTGVTCSGPWADFDITAPRDTVDACDHLVDVINDVIWHCADDPRSDQARCPDGVRSVGPAVGRFRACVRTAREIAKPAEPRRAVHHGRQDVVVPGLSKVCSGVSAGS